MGDWGDGEEVGGVEVGLDWGGRPAWSRSELVDVGADGGLGWGGRAGGRLVVLDCLEGRRGGELGLQREMIERESSLYALVTNLRAGGVGCPLEDLPITEGRLRYSNSELTEIVDFRAVFFVLGDTRIILRGIIC